MPPKILQFGGGNFLRAFLGPAVAALNAEADFGGSIVVVKPTEPGNYAALREQNGRYHVFTRGRLGGATVDEVAIMNNISQVIHPYREWRAFLASAAEPTLRTIVSNTTEAGIRYVPEPWVEDRCPQEFPAKLCRWLWARWRAMVPNTFGALGEGQDSRVDILPCELVEGNGDRLRTCVHRYAADWNLPTGFVRWLDEHCTFANTLVDRIVSGKPAAGSPLHQRLTFADDLITVAEPYALWAIQNAGDLSRRFPLHHTSFGAVYADSLEQYRTLKVRILNGAHILMVATGLPTGIATVGEYLKHPEWGPWLETTLREEVLPTLPFSEQVKTDYLAAVLDRFRNPFLQHQLKDIALNRAAKWPVRIGPTLAFYRERGEQVPEGLRRAEGMF